MQPAIALEYPSRPSLLSIYARALFLSRAGVPTAEALPRLATQQTGVRVDRQVLAAYRTACELPSEDRLPLLYPHVFSFRMQVWLVSVPQFPLRMFGALHCRQHIFQRRPIGVDEPLDFECRIGDARPVKKGLEFDILTRVSASGEPAWEGISAYLSLGKYGEPVDPPALAKMPERTACTHQREWRVPGDMGRRYARVTSDYNPIHVSSLLARLFGYPRAIIHGMWSVARALGSLPPLAADQPIRLDVAFKGPVLVNSAVKMLSDSQIDRHRFDLYCEDNPKPCVCGLLRYETSDAWRAAGGA